MAWLRLDELFLEHPKIVNLTDRQLRVHLGALLYSCRHYTLGHVSTGALRTLGANRQTIDRLIDVGLWHRVTDGVEIHDFSVYNGLGTEEKVTRYLLDNPTASANEVAKEVGGNRKLVLATIKKLRFPDGTATEPPGSSAGSRAGSENHPGTGSSRAGDPSPSPEKPPQPTNQPSEARPPAPAETAQNGHGWQAEVDEEGDHDIDPDIDISAPLGFDYATILKDMPE